MRKVVLIHNRLVIGGPAIAIAEIIKKLNTQFEFFLVVGKPLHDEYDATYLFTNIPNLTIIPLGTMQRMPNVWGDFKSYFELKKILKKIQPDVVHTHGTKPGVLGRIVAKQLGIKKIIHTYHGHIFHSYFNKWISGIIVKMERWLGKKTSHIIVLSEVLKKEIVETYKIVPTAKTYLLPLGLDLTAFQIEKEEKRNKFRQKFVISDNEIAIGIIGRMTPIKNMKMMAKAIVELKNTTTFINLKFFFIGDGAEKSSIEQYLIHNGISTTILNNIIPKVTFTSWLHNMDVVMNGLDIVCLTSLNEGTPVCIIEAMASQKPIIATNVGSISEMLKNGQSGILIESNNCNALVQAITTLSENIDLQYKMGLNAFKTANQLYINNNHWNLLSNIYND